MGLPLAVSFRRSQRIVGIQYHFYLCLADWSERPIYNASKTLYIAQRKYGIVQLEGLARIFELNKFHQYLYGRPFVIVIDYKPLLSLFAPDKNGGKQVDQVVSEAGAIRLQAGVSPHGKTRFPVGSDVAFDQKGEQDDDQNVFWIGAGATSKETSKDPTLVKATTL